MNPNTVAAVDGGPASAAALRVQDLKVQFSTESGRVDAVRGVSLSIQPGEVLALVGESGSGKSTVALGVMGLLPGNAAVTGDVRIAGNAIDTTDEAALCDARGRILSMVFQEPSTALNPLLTIGGQIAEVITNHQKISLKQAALRAIELLGTVGIPDPAIRAGYYPNQLSGGQRQRVVIAIAIANKPQLLIADEPTTALDVTVQANILELLRTLAAEMNMAILLVTHNMGVVADFAEQVAVMYHGELVEVGAVEDVLLRPRHEYTKRLLAAVPRLAVEARDRPLADAPEGKAAEPAVLELDQVGVRYGRGSRAFNALDGVSFSLVKGQTLGLVGESGSGKSTAGRAALGLIKPSTGSVRLFGEDLRTLRHKTRKALQSRIGIVLQDPVASLDPRMSVAECIAEPLLVHRRTSAATRRTMVRDALEAVQLPGAVHGRYPHELSGGQRQRVSIARALILQPQLLIADEATSALDVSVQASVLDVLKNLQEQFGFACLFISHDLAVVQDMAQQVVVLRAGQIMEAGPTATTLIAPRNDYTRDLLAAVPVPDPVLQRQRRLARLSSSSQVRSQVATP
ncbi:dipeptide ABC transporter ATP-binding protein [Arthrobacter dokdonensis]|uniref:dipeptide ABC transporter ATP-binding protein n=1 Tax=Arthrobacter dokdonellae TaxID=2211210 RepID=UPI000DE5B69B|nr:ABC transporter ATP-binding protein [Arthrobacter dokdonellae]